MRLIDRNTRLEIIRLKYVEGLKWPEVYNRLSKHLPKEWENMSNEERKQKLRCMVRHMPEYEQAVKKDARPKEEKPPKIDVIQNQEPEVVTINWKGNKIVRFALMGDTQINSKDTQLTHLHSFYDECARQGIKHIYHTGDIDEGEQMRPGHQYECYNQGADDHVDEICRVYPERIGITTHFIIGNHDASLIKRCGYDIGPAIAARRNDMEYLGRDCAIVKLTPNCTLELRHPWNGSSYALSYQIQKMVDAMAGGEKPNILAVGHYHKTEFIFYRNIHCFQTGCFQAQTGFMRGKSIAAHMGGWIIEIEVDDEGTIETIKQQFIPYYKAIKEDYKNWRQGQ